MVVEASQASIKSLDIAKQTKYVSSNWWWEISIYRWNVCLGIVCGSKIYWNSINIRSVAFAEIFTFEINSFYKYQFRYYIFVDVLHT